MSVISTSCFLGILTIFFFHFFFNDPATTEIYTLSLHDALPICHEYADDLSGWPKAILVTSQRVVGEPSEDRKSTRLNSSHVEISYAVFCLKKKKKSRKTRH